MPLGKNPVERYALKLRSACEKLGWKSSSLDSVGKIERVKAEHGGKLGPGYVAFVHASDDGYVTINTVGDFPEHLLECVVHRAEILR